MPRTKKRGRGKKAVERTAYRWMMRCLRAMDKAGLSRKRSVELTVHAAKARATRHGFRDFMKLWKPAAREALAMLRNGGFRVGCEFKTDAVPGGETSQFPRLYTIVFSAAW
jgi:phosphoserine phosphatase